MIYVLYLLFDVLFSLYISVSTTKLRYPKYTPNLFKKWLRGSAIKVYAITRSKDKDIFIKLYIRLIFTDIILLIYSIIILFIFILV